MRDTGIIILRLGLAATILWFGFSQLFDATSWVAWVPGWATDLTGLSSAQIVLLNGGAEVALSSLLALGVFTRVCAGLLALHLIMLVFEIGINEIGVRDFGLFIAFTALALLGPDRLAFDASRNKDIIVTS